ncbi:hypothetical protein HJC23_009076 [Cyclotella cryptica]|uniref:Nodulin-like domain-containing protein n=1 Tax=Cyclotella cryptica TaxID=29204 RepID=A0ABD3QYS4_9STRA
MLRKKTMTASPEKQPREHPLSSLGIDADDTKNDIITTPSSQSPLSSPARAPLPPSISTATPATSTTTTNLPLLTTAYLSALTTGATTYAFSFYSSALKLSLHLSQSQLDTLSSATFCAGVLSWIPGMVVDRYGARVGIVMGGMGNVCVLSLYWLIATGRVWELKKERDEDDVTTFLIVLLSSLGVLTFVGCALITGSVFKLIVETCGKGSKGKAVGCAKGYVGVGSGVYVCLFRALFSEPSSGPDAGQSGQDNALLSSMSLAALLPSSALWETGATSKYSWPIPTFTEMGSAATLSTTRSFLKSGNTPPNPEIMNTLNFLLMASCLSFLAAVIPALLFLPKRDEMQAKKRRDGTRNIHFRVVYAGLILLGLFVVGTSLAKLQEDEKKIAASGAKKMNGGATGLPSATVNTTLDFHSIESRNRNAPAVGSAWNDMQYNHYLWDDIQSGSKVLENQNASEKIQQLKVRKATTALGAEGNDKKQFNRNDSSIPFASRSWKSIRRLSPSAPERHWGTAILLLFLWWGPALSLLIIPPRKEPSGGYATLSPEDGDGENDEINGDGDELRYEEIEVTEHDAFLEEVAPSRRPLSLTKTEGDSSDSSTTMRRDFTLIEMLRTGHAWLMAWTFLVLVGGGTLMTCNIGQMTEALGFDSDITPASLALFSAAQGASRVITGSISESALAWNVPWFCNCFGGGRGVVRPAFLVLASLVSAVAHLTLAVASTEEGFALGVTLSGVAFGMAWPLMVLITGEVFGTLHVGANYMFFDGFSSAMGTLLLSKFVAQSFYDEHIMKSHGDSIDGENYQCYGKECFQMSHVVVCLLSFTCVVSSFGVMRATKDVYRR